MAKAIKRVSARSWELVGSMVYATRGYRTHSPGFWQYRSRYLHKIVSQPETIEIFDKSAELPLKYGWRLDERVVEYPWILSRLRSMPGNLVCLDAGSTLNHEFLVKQDVIARNKWTILTLSPEVESFWDRGISYVYDDLRAMPFRDNWFDVVTCISVLEHVGMDNVHFSPDASHRQRNTSDYLRAIVDMKRVLKPGGRLLVTIPFGRYEDHGWLQQFNSGMLSSLIASFAPQAVQKTFFRYTDTGWRFAAERECESLSYFDVLKDKLTTGRKTRLDSDFAAAARGIACVDLQK